MITAFIWYPTEVLAIAKKKKKNWGCKVLKKKKKTGIYRCHGWLGSLVYYQYANVTCISNYQQ